MGHTAEEYEAGEVLVADKPLRWTSFDLCNKLRYLLRRAKGLRKIKVGHAGTLDPLATGVVVLCTGRATKRLSALMDHDKRYEATLEFGRTTPSYDQETDTDALWPTEHLTRALLEATLRERFTGDVQQVPPLHSAISVDGHRAYEWARGERKGELELKPRQIHIYSITILDWTPPLLRLEVHCGRGTYIRSLARDLGRAVNSGATLVALRRTAVGPYNIDQARTPEQIEQEL